MVALANQKGGVGKTTTAVNLGAALAEQGRRVLLVDMDPQGGLAVGLGYNPYELEPTVYNLLLEEGMKPRDVIMATSVAGMDLVPSNIDLSAAELVLVSEVAREQALLRSLSPARDEYDFILLDCPPSLGLLTVNALTAADGVMVPVACEFYALRGLALLTRTITKVRERLNPGLKVDGVLATMFDGRTLHGREVLERLKEAFPGELFESVVPRTVRFQEAPVTGKPILEYAPDSPGAEAYRQVAREFLERVDGGKFRNP